MVSSIFIALTDRDVVKALERVTAQDIILTDIYCPAHIGRTVAPAFQDGSDEILISLVVNWFKKQCKTSQISYGYVNNFYQSSIRPIAGFLSAIDEVTALKGKSNIMFYLPSSPLWKVPTSTYYLAEYESAGIHLYDRHAAFLPYVEAYLQTRQISYKTGKRHWPLQAGILNPARLWGVFLFRFLIDVKASVKRLTEPSPQINNIFDKVFIIRTVGQAITIIPYLSATQHTVLVIIGTSHTDEGSYNLLQINTAKQNNITIVRGLHPGIIRTVNIYAKTLWQILRCRNKKILYKGIELNLSQALREILVMNAGLEIYQRQIGEKLVTIRTSFLFSLEQKSPHAFVDANWARKCATFSAQIQCCQQAFFDLPNPVCADYFLCETPKIQKAFQDCWPKLANKVGYVGSFQGVNQKNSQEKSNKQNEVLRICLFTGFEKNMNIKMLKAFAEFSQTQEIKVSVKLHPRDRENYSNIFPEAIYIHSYQGMFSEFCKEFDLAVTFPSGVISDLLFTDLPFLVYIPEFKGYQLAEGEFLPAGIKPVVTISELFGKIQSLEGLRVNHVCILNTFRKGEGIITDIESIENNLNTLINIHSEQTHH